MILITGGAGYIGSHTNKLFANNGYQTVVYDNLVNGHRSFVQWGEFVQGDLASPDELRSCFRRYPIEAVIHFGGFAYVGESVTDPATYYRNNVVNTLNLLDLMREYHVPHLIFSSSCTTYGLPQSIPLTEDHPQRPVNPYGWSKFMIEQILRDFDRAYGIKSVSLRYFNAAGADPEGDIGEDHEPETHLIPLVLDVAGGRRADVKILGTDYETPDGTCIRDYIHVTDLAKAHLLALEYLRREQTSDVFNLGNSHGYSVREVIGTVEKVTGRAVPYVEADRRSGDPPVLIGSARKAQAVLHWKPDFADLATIVETAWQWQQKMASLHEQQEEACDS